MKVTKLVVPACCKQVQVVFKLDRPLTESMVSFLVTNGFTASAHFIAAGMLYADNSDLFIMGPFGANRITAKCKTKEQANCDQIFNKFEELITKMG